MSKNFIDEINWRSMISSNTFGIEKIFRETNKPLVAYIGFDPTAKHLHIGNLAAIHMLRHFQLCGHKPLIIIGGGTGFIGDPSGKTDERKFLTKAQIEENIFSLKKEFMRFLDFECGALSAEILNNLDWLDNLQLIDFLRLYGKTISVNEMIKRDSVKNRLSEGGISFTEFSYQVLQAYDFYWLKKNKNCSIQMGGSDQWGNIVAGIDLISKNLKEDAHGITLPLIEKKGGGKFGKTESGNIWLNGALTSPYKFYQFWKNIADQDISKLLRVFTFLTKQEIEHLEYQATTNPNLIKETLAEIMVKYIHSQEALEKVKNISNILYGKNTLMELEGVDDSLIFESTEGMNKAEFTREEYGAFESTIDLLSKALTSTLESVSKSEIKRLVEANAISVNKVKINLNESTVKPSFKLLKGKFLLIQKGKIYSIVIVKN